MTLPRHRKLLPLHWISHVLDVVAVGEKQAGASTQLGANMFILIN